MEIINIEINDTIDDIVIDVSDTSAVESINGQIGAVVLDADDISDEGTTNQFVTTAEKTIWNNMVVLAASAAEESAAFANGARIVIRTDLI